MKTDNKTNMIGTANKFSVLGALIKRHFLVFIKNWTTVLFTLMVPIAILLVYVLFLRPMEVSQIKGAFEDYGASWDKLDPNDQKQIYGLVDTWMMAGILSVTCFTVSLNTNTILVRDKERGTNKDFISSPIDSKLITISYFTFNMIVTFAINLIVYIICLFWLIGYGGVNTNLLPGIKNGFALLGVIILSTINASLQTFFICSFIKTESTMASITAIFSTIIGFLNGAYLPISMMPTSIQYLTEFFSGAYSAGLLRHYFMESPLENTLKMLTDTYGGEYSKIANELANESFPSTLEFFGQEVSTMWMSLTLFIFIIIFIVLNLFITPGNIISPKAIFKKKSKKKKQVAHENFDDSEKQDDSNTPIDN